MARDCVEYGFDGGWNPTEQGVSKDALMSSRSDWDRLIGEPYALKGARTVRGGADLYRLELKRKETTDGPDSGETGPDSQKELSNSYSSRKRGGCLLYEISVQFRYINLFFFMAIPFKC